MDLLERAHFNAAPKALQAFYPADMEDRLEQFLQLP
jgi:hypothetical protein